MIAAIVPPGEAPPLGSIPLNCDETWTADSEWCLVAERCHLGGGVGSIAPPSPAHPPGLWDFSVFPSFSLKTWTTLPSVLQRVALSWPGALMALRESCGCPPSCALPPQVVPCVPSHITLCSPLEPEQVYWPLCFMLLCPVLTRPFPHHRDILGVSKPLHYAQPGVHPVCHPFSLCLRGHSQKWNNGLQQPWSQSEIRMEMWALCVFYGHVGKYMDLLVRHLL